MKFPRKSLGAIVALLGMSLLAGCATRPPESAKIRNLSQAEVAGSVFLIHDNAGEARIELKPDGTATATNIYGTRGVGNGGGYWLLSPEKDAVCLHGTVWWKSHPCWTFYGPDWAHATDAITTFNNGAHIGIEMKKTGLSS